MAFFGLGHVLHGLFGQNYHVDIDQDWKIRETGQEISDNLTID